MKIQYAIVDPKLCSTPGYTTIAGVATLDREIPDYSAHQIIIDPVNQGGFVSLIDLNKTLVSREAEADDGSWDAYHPTPLNELAFHEVLTRHIFKLPMISKPAGEVAFVKTDLPGTAQGQHSYVVFGLVQGSLQDLEQIADQVFEVNLHRNGPVDQYEMSSGMAINTGLAARHKLGNHILQILHQPLWGFGEHKYAMTSLVSNAEFTKQQENRQHIINHGKHSPDVPISVSGRIDEGFVKFLRAFSKMGGELKQWQNSDEMAHTHKLSDRAIRALPDFEPYT